MVCWAKYLVVRAYPDYRRTGLKYANIRSRFVLLSPRGTRQVRGVLGGGNVDKATNHSERSSAPRRNKRRMDPTTGLSLREPFAADNVITVRSNSIPWLRALGISVRRPFHNARAIVERYRDWPSFITKYAFTEKESSLLGDAIGKRLLNKQLFSVADLEKLQRLRDGKNTSYLIIRGLTTLPVFNRFPLDEEFPEKHRDTEYLIGKKYGVEGDRAIYQKGSEERLTAKVEALKERYELTDYIICGLARYLNCSVEPRYKEHRLALNVLTDPSEQQSSDRDNVDMALRFHQSTVEKKLPKPNKSINYGEIGCLFRIYVCVKNDLLIPIYLIPVQELIDQHLCEFIDNSVRRQDILKTLQEGNFERFGPRSPSDSEFSDIGSSPILRDMGGRDWMMSFDHERVKAYGRQAAEERAIFELREAIRRAKRDAIMIRLKPGEILIVNNYRALMSRREVLPVSLDSLRRLAPALVRIDKPLKRWRPKFTKKLKTLCRTHKSRTRQS